MCIDGSSDLAGVLCSLDDDGAKDPPVGLAGVEQCSDALFHEVGEAVADAFDPFDQVVQRPSGSVADPGDVEVADLGEPGFEGHGGQHPFCAFAAFEQPVREIRSWSAARGSQDPMCLCGCRTGVPVAVAGVGALGTALAVAGPAQRVGPSAEVSDGLCRSWKRKDLRT